MLRTDGRVRLSPNPAEPPRSSALSLDDRPSLKNVLFICSRNKLRSPTAEQIFAEHDGIATASAGTDHDADEPLTPELLQWADLIFVMEKRHRSKLSQRFRAHTGGKRIICLDIPDDYDFMAPELVQLLRAKVSPFLP